MKKKNILLLCVFVGNAYPMDAPKTVNIESQFALCNGKLLLHNTKIYADEIRFNPQLNQLAIVSGNKIGLHELTPQGKVVKETGLICERNNCVRGIDFDCSGQYIATCGIASDKVYIYSTATAEKISITTLKPRYLLHTAFHPQKRKFMVLGADDKLSMHSMNKHGLIKKTEECRTPFSTSFCKDLFLNSAGQCVVLSKKPFKESNCLYVCTINSPEQMIIEGHDSKWYNMCLDSVHNRVALAGDGKGNQVVDIYDLNHQQLLSQLLCGIEEKIYSSHIVSMNFDKTGKYLALGFSGKKKIIVYNVDSKEVTHTYEDESCDIVEKIRFSPDGRLLVALIEIKNLSRTEIFVAQLSQS